MEMGGDFPYPLLVSLSRSQLVGMQARRLLAVSLSSFSRFPCCNRSNSGKKMKSGKGTPFKRKKGNATAAGADYVS